ncbi:unnamed protein product [Soboliphyme baturini]|uniref:Phosphofurin acidic cluster sorting protein 1 n=1 Tax=Soboliphyme baturini TaxID=241478 RepID=A0A183IS66_9BILA|nr:unnamed protein product [Soboliphyme baturini]
MEQSHVLPMRLFATWEVDRTGTDCVPRLCMLTINRLTILRSLETDLSCFIIAAKLQGFKRTLRSNDIVVSSSTNGVVDIDLDISFTLQYPHFVKNQSNCLVLMLQRRKKYKNRPMLGFKTLAIGSINLTNVLQHGAIRELALMSNGNAAQMVAKVYFMSFVSQPVEQDETKLKGDGLSVLDLVRVVCFLSERRTIGKRNMNKDQSEGTDDDDEEWSVNEEGASDSEIPIEDQLGIIGGLSRKSAKLASHPARFSLRQKNLKQKFVALLKKFKIPDEEIAEDEGGKKAAEQEIEALFEELENLSDSGPEADDTVSIKSTPKPSLRPYFPSRETLPVLDDEASEESKESGESPAGDADATDDTSDAVVVPVPHPNICRRSSHDQGKFTSLLSPQLSEKLQISLDESQKAGGSGEAASSGKKSRDDKRRTNLRQVSAGLLPERLGLDRLGQSETSVGSKEFFSTPLEYAPVAQQLTALFPSDRTALPDTLFVISAFDVHSSTFLKKLGESGISFAVLSTFKETKSLLSAIINRVQKLCNISTEQRQVIKICIIGADLFFSHWLKAFTELFGSRPNEWVRFFRFYIVSQNNGVIHKFIASVDKQHASLFIADTLWRDWWEKSDLSDTGDC